MKHITKWQRFDPKKGKFVHNHIEDGHSQRFAPEPKSERQQIWAKQKWRKVFACLP